MISKDAAVVNHEGAADIGQSLQNIFSFDINLMHLDNSFRLNSKLINSDGEKFTVKDRWN